MSIWKPISKSKLIEFINETFSDLSEKQVHFYEAIRISPQKWQLDPWGNHGGGFWVIGLIGQTVLWYNDIEEGFNYSTYTTHGEIDDYWCDQDEFDLAIRRLLTFVETGHTNIKCGPPNPI